MTLDDVAATMRDRFTAAVTGPTPGVVTLTAEEWNTLARGIYLRDALEAVVASPTADNLARAQREIDLTRVGG